MFCVVEMTDEMGKSVEAIPESWLKTDEKIGTQCYWPPVKNPTQMIAQKKKPSPDWNLYAARVLKKYGMLI